MYPSPPVDERESFAGRTCLFKECGRRFVPRKQDLRRAKYCSAACRGKARRWRRWLKVSVR